MQSTTEGRRRRLLAGNQQSNGTEGDRNALSDEPEAQRDAFQQLPRSRKRLHHAALTGSPPKAVARQRPPERKLEQRMRSAVARAAADLRDDMHHLQAPAPPPYILSYLCAVIWHLFTVCGVDLQWGCHQASSAKRE